MPRISKYRDRAWSLQGKILSYFVLFSGIHLSHAQQIGRSQLDAKTNQSSAEGKLSVSLTVVGSLTVLFGPNGEQTLVIANSPAREMKQMLAGLKENKGSHPAKEFDSQKMHPVRAKSTEHGKEQ
jgi:hypothetical protein